MNSPRSEARSVVSTAASSQSSFAGIRAADSFQVVLLRPFQLALPRSRRACRGRQRRLRQKRFPRGSWRRSVLAETKGRAPCQLSPRIPCGTKRREVHPFVRRPFANVQQGIRRPPRCSLPDRRIGSLDGGAPLTTQSRFGWAAARKSSSDSASVVCWSRDPATTRTECYASSASSLEPTKHAS